MKRAKNRDGTLIAPMMLANMRALGVTSIEAICGETLCGHAGVIDASALPDELPVPDVSLKLRCSKCGSKNVHTRPLWTQYRPSGAATR